MAIIYFIQAGEGGCIKIGITAILARRLAALQTANSVPLKVLGVLDGDVNYEARLHRRFADHHATSGEWFFPHPDLINWIEKNKKLPHLEKPVYDVPLTIASLPKRIEFARYRRHLVACNCGWRGRRSFRTTWPACPNCHAPGDQIIPAEQTEEAKAFLLKRERMA